MEAGVVDGQGIDPHLSRQKKLTKTKDYFQGQGHLWREDSWGSRNHDNSRDSYCSHQQPPQTTVVPGLKVVTQEIIKLKKRSHLSRKNDKIMVMAGLEKNMAVESPSGNLKTNKKYNNIVNIQYT